MLDLNIHFLQTVSGGLWVKLAFVCDFSTFWYVNLHNASFFGSVSDHDKYGIKLKLSTVEFYSY